MLRIGILYDTSPRAGLLIRVAPIPHAQYIDPIAVIVKPHAPIADTKPKLGRVNTAQCLDVASPGGGKPSNAGNNPQRHGAIEFGQIGLRLG